MRAIAYADEPLAQARLPKPAGFVQFAAFEPSLTSPTSTAHTAIREREGAPNFERIVLTCVSTVRWLTTSVSAISRFVLP